VNDPEVIRSIVPWVVVALLIGWIAWLFRDRLIRIWWGSSGIEIDKRTK
jgi:hypothetical protein